MPRLLTARHRLANLAVFAVCLAAVGWPRSSLAEPALRVNFNGPKTIWELLSDRTSYRVLAHECVAEGAHVDAAANPVGPLHTAEGDLADSPSGAERLVVAAPAGQSVLAACPVGHMPVVDEFRARMWVKTSQPGTSLAARVVLPRVMEATTNTPRTVIVRGTQIRETGSWQPLELTQLPRLLADQVRLLRTTTANASIDPREAYVDAIVLVIPGHAQGTEIMTDNLEVEGVLFDSGGAESSPTDLPLPPDEDVTASAARTAPEFPRREAERVRTQGDILLVDGRPFLPRAIEWNGEPLDFLAARGFNTIVLRDPPTEGQLVLAERYDLWLVCPPPDVQAEFHWTKSWQRVLAWTLSDDAARDRTDHFRNWADTIATHAEIPPRPMVLSPTTEWTALSEIAGIVLARHPLDIYTQSGDFSDWLAERRRNVRPGAPLWVSLGTQLGARASAEAGAMLGLERVSLNVDDAQLESLVRVATMDVCRGFLFRSTTPLDATDTDTRRRAATLERINQRLRVVGPWLAAGTSSGKLLSTDGRNRAGLLAVDRAQLLIAEGQNTGAGSGPLSVRSAAAGNAPASSAFTIPGVPDSSQAWLLTPASLRQLPLTRVAGGMRIVVESQAEAMVVITQDPRTISELKQIASRDGPAAVRLARDVAEMQARRLAEASQQYAEFGIGGQESERLASEALTALRQVDAYLATSRADAAYGVTRQVSRRLEEVLREQEEAVRSQLPLTNSPFYFSADTLDEHLKLVRDSRSYAAGENLLPGGDFEDLDRIREFGWQHYHDPASGAVTNAELSSVQPQQGRFALKLSTKTSGRSSSAEGPAIRVLSPPIVAPSGRTISISGWVRVTSESGDPVTLEIEDSPGGPEIALRISPVSSWTPFTLLRMAGTDEFRVGFSLVGAGSAEIDAVMIRPLEPPIARRLPATEGNGSPVYPR